MRGCWWEAVQRGELTGLQASSVQQVFVLIFLIFKSFSPTQSVCHQRAECQDANWYAPEAEVGRYRREILPQAVLRC